MDGKPAGRNRRPPCGSGRLVRGDRQAGFSANKVVDVNIVDVVEENGKLWPTRLRERIRAAGPTVHYATGYKPADAAFIAV